MNKFASSAIASAAIAAALGLAGLGGSAEAYALPGINNWCPGDFWDPSWGTNWDWNSCHGNVIVPPNNITNGPTIINRPPPIIRPPGGPGGPGGPGWARRTRQPRWTRRTRQPRWTRRTGWRRWTGGT